MKQKEHIIPPSKETDARHTQKQRLEDLRKERDQTFSKACELSERLDAESSYEESLRAASKALNIDKSSLDLTYQNNKGELVNRFRQARGHGPKSVLAGATVVLAALTALTGYFGISGADPVAIFPGLLGLLGTITFGALAKKEYTDTGMAKNTIQNAVIDHQKRLTYASPS